MPTSPAAAERPRDPKQSDEALAPVRWGVLGASNFALKVSLPGMKRGPLTQLAALASRDIGKATAAARSLGIPKAYGSYEELLADPEIEAIYNPLPNHLHVPWTARAADAGKHVLCEKPIALNARRRDSWSPLRDEPASCISEAFMVRHHPQWQQARELVRRRPHRRPASRADVFSLLQRDAANIRNQPDVGGGALYDIGCYAVSHVAVPFRREPVRAVALVDRDPELRHRPPDVGAARLRRRRTLTFTCRTQPCPTSA